MLAKCSKLPCALLVVIQLACLFGCLHAFDAVGNETERFWPNLMRKLQTNKPIFHATQLCEKACDKTKSARRRRHTHTHTQTQAVYGFSPRFRLFPVTD